MPFGVQLEAAPPKTRRQVAIPTSKTPGVLVGELVIAYEVAIPSSISVSL